MFHHTVYSVHCTMYIVPYIKLYNCFCALSGFCVVFVPNLSVDLPMHRQLFTVKTLNIQFAYPIPLTDSYETTKYVCARVYVDSTYINISITNNNYNICDGALLVDHVFRPSVYTSIRIIYNFSANVV